MNLHTSTSPKTWFTQKVICARFVMAGDDDDKSEEEHKLVGVLILQDDVKRRMVGGQTEHLEKFANEEQRVGALSKWFSIELDAAEREGIVGMVSQIR